MRAFVFGVVLLGMGTAAHAISFNSAGAGLMSCSIFAKAYEQDPNTTEQFYFAWAQGFMTGVNAPRIAPQQKNLGGMSTPDQKRAIRMFCETHPLRDYSDAVFELWQSLPPMTP